MHLQVSPTRPGQYSSPSPPEGPKHVAELLGLAAAMLALPGGEQASAALLAGVLGLGAGSQTHRSSQDDKGEGGQADEAGVRRELFAAALAVALMAGSVEAREVMLEPLRREELHDGIALLVVLESIAQVGCYSSKFVHMLT